MLLYTKNAICTTLLIISILYPNAYPISSDIISIRFANILTYEKPIKMNSILDSNSNYSKESLKSKIKEYIIPIQLATFLYLEYGIDHYSSSNKVSKPNRMDNYFRNRLKWSLSNIDKAVYASDLLLYGFFLGSVPTLPFTSNNGYLNTLKTSLNVLSLNGIITDIVKMTVKRQRPDSYFQTREHKDDSFRSFFSGHTSTAFAIGTSNAIILSKIYPDKKKLIWFGNLSLAAATGYFRMAGDKHYFSDVICGGVIGYIIGKWTHSNMEKDSFNFSYATMQRFPTIYVSFKI